MSDSDGGKAVTGDGHHSSRQPRRRGRPRIRDTDKDVTHGVLIEAARRAFARHGYHQATVEQIATEAGCSRATFYLHFKGKGDFLPLLLQGGGDPFRPLYGRLPGVLRVGDESLLENWIIEAMTLWDEVADFMRPVYEAAEADAALFRTFFPDEMPGIREFTEALQQAFPGLEQRRCEITAAVIASPLLHFFQRHLRGASFDRELAATTIARAWGHVIDDIRREEGSGAIPARDLPSNGENPGRG
ncbi:helix-turn-helix transcriptional regulator [Sagittula sp. NFXS13]|uniref:TetR/AcrR family transcriptional regulator n=1 Tax=Sagittula sp. NFXS13 TaxID=2819095 RepID=UPI0032DE91F3